MNVFYFSPGGEDFVLSLKVKCTIIETQNSLSLHSILNTIGNLKGALYGRQNIV